MSAFVPHAVADNAGNEDVDDADDEVERNE